MTMRDVVFTYVAYILAALAAVMLVVAAARGLAGG
jgi:hypothetical protein